MDGCLTLSNLLTALEVLLAILVPLSVNISLGGPQTCTQLFTNVLVTFISDPLFIGIAATYLVNLWIIVSRHRFSSVVIDEGLTISIAIC